MRKSPYKDSWTRIGDAALGNPLLFLWLLIKKWIIGR